MTIPQDSRAPHRQQRWIALHNVGPDEIPPYGIVEVVEGVRPEQGSALTPDGGPTVVQVRKPQTDCCSAFLINGPLPIPVRGYGQPGTNDYPCYVRYNTADGTPTPNDMWGTVKASYAIGRGRQGLAIVGDADTVDGVPLVRVMCSERLIRVTPFGDGVTLGMVYAEKLVWAIFGEEATELMFVVAVIYILWIFRAAWLPGVDRPQDFVSMFTLNQKRPT